jgi:hypothetical protein
VYLTAHHVVSPTTLREGINAFLYLHGLPAWRVPPVGVPDQNPGQLVQQKIEVTPPGNRVKSYLDVVAPDDAARAEIRQSFITFVSQVQREPLPWEGVVGRCLFRFGIERSLAPHWRQELHRLYLEIQAIDHRP